MTIKKIQYICLATFTGILLSACQLNNATADSQATTAETEVVLLIPSITPTATTAPSPTVTHTPLPTSVPTQEPTATLAPSNTPAATATPTISPTPASRDHYVLERPINRISDELQDYIERTYPYGGTAFGRREIHPGVEFVNPAGTPVLAAADGVVVFAGQDNNEMPGPRLNYYGNLVIVQHNFVDAAGDTIHSAYAHMSTINVNVGDSVATGQLIGMVGQTGIAIGPHLHFEVRAGDPMIVTSVRNPALWIKPYPLYGTLAGKVTLSNGRDPAGMVIIAESINNSVSTRETYVYGGEPTGGDASWNENFALPDLPQGSYRIILQQDGITYDIQTVTIADGKTAWLTFDLND